MKIKLKELQRFIRESVRDLIKEEKDDDEIDDIPDPEKVTSNVYGLDDQETTTKLQNKNIRIPQ